jgi:transposase
LSSADVKRLMTIPGVDATVALSIVAAVGTFGRSSSPEKLVSYLGLNPRVKQSGGQPAQPRADYQARSRARPRDARRGGMGGIQNPWAAARLLSAHPRSTRNAGRRSCDRAQAGRLCWHLVTKGEDYAFARPSLTAQKMRRLELRAGMPSNRGHKGKAAGYSLKEIAPVNAR